MKNPAGIPAGFFYAIITIHLISFTFKSDQHKTQLCGAIFIKIWIGHFNTGADIIGTIVTRLIKPGTLTSLAYIF